MRPRSAEVIFLMFNSLDKAGIKREPLSPEVALSLCHPDDLEEGTEFGGDFGDF